MGSSDVFILGGARTPMAEYAGKLKDVSALELGAIAARAAMQRTGVKPGDVDHVVFGNVLQTSSDAVYGARHVGLKSGVPSEVPALTVNRLCGSGIQATHYYIDALAMYMVLDPGQFEVIVTNNLFGDIVTDLGATFQGGLGMAASGNIHPGKTSMFEPVHGSAPKFAGKNIANPIGAISSAALMLDTLGWKKEAAAIDAAVLKAVRENQVTTDIGGKLGTREAGDFIAAAVTD